MRNFFCFTVLFCGILVAKGQHKLADSLRIALAEETTDSLRANTLWKLAASYAQDKPDSELYIAQRALTLCRRINYVKGEMKDLKLMAEAYQFLGNYTQALRYYLLRLKLDEKNPKPERQVVTLLSIANLYQLEGDYKQALVYARKGYLLIDKFKLEDYRWYSYMTFGDTYDKMSDVTNALYYDQRAYALAVKQKNVAWIGMCLNNRGNAYVKAHQYTAALDDYKKAIPYLKSNHIESFLCESYQGIASVCYQQRKLDPAAFYAKLSLNLAISRSFNEKQLRSCQLLTDIYKAHHLADSALVYQGKLLIMKDSVYSKDKERQIANLTISETIRQKERLQQQQDEEKDRKYKLNLLLVGLLIPFSFLVSVIMSKKKMHARVIEFSGIISLLLLFEYLTLLLHPLVVSWTNHSPFMEIAFFVTIAAVLTPSHHRMEHWMLLKLTAHKHQNHPATAKPTLPVGEEPASAGNQAGA